MNSEYPDNPEVDSVRLAIALCEAGRDQSWEVFSKKARNWMRWSWFCATASVACFVALFFGVSLLFAIAGCLWGFNCWHALWGRRQVLQWRDEFLYSRTETILQLKEYLKTMQ